MPKAPPTPASASASGSSSNLNPTTYRALKTEQGVFTTPPYSAQLKHLWKFKDEDIARESAESLWERFEGYRKQGDFVGMDVTRKFIQMGRTRSLRYALRKGGRKYEPTASADSKSQSKEKGKTKANSVDADGEEDRRTKTEIPRTGEIYDQGKLDGANIFEGYLDKCWASGEYAKAWEDWREAGKMKGKKAETSR